MFKVITPRVMRRRMGLSSRQWRMREKADRRGTRDTRAKRRKREARES